MAEMERVLIQGAAYVVMTGHVGAMRWRAWVRYSEVRVEGSSRDEAIRLLKARLLDEWAYDRLMEQRERLYACEAAVERADAEVRRLRQRLEAAERKMAAAQTEEAAARAAYLEVSGKIDKRMIELEEVGDGD